MIPSPRPPRRVLKIDRRGDQRPVDPHLHRLVAAFELPFADRAARKPVADAGVVDEVARVGRAPMRGEIGWRSSGDIALHPRTDRDRDHVALDPLLVADAGVEAVPDHVDQVVVRGDLEAHSGKGGKEAGRIGGRTFIATITGTLSLSVPRGL